MDNKGQAESQCTCHGQPQTRTNFRDDVSWRAFKLNQLCQESQDAITDDEPSVEVELQEAFRRNPFLE